MENTKLSLCPMCDHHPEIEIAGDEVRIGEAGNLVVLKKDEWNQSGQLTKVGAGAYPARCSSRLAAHFGQMTTFQPSSSCRRCDTFFAPSRFMSRARTRGA
jgi:hypothetical protein